MTSGRIKPTHGVSLPGNNDLGGRSPQMGMGMGQGNMGMMGGMNTQVTHGDMVKSALSQNLGGNPSGGFNWGNYGNSAYEDDALRAMKGDKDIDVNQTQYFIERVSPAMEICIKHIFHRSGNFYDHYKNARDSFPLTSMGTRCPIRSAFIEAINKQGDFTRSAAFYSAPMFGHRLIEQLRTGKEDFTVNDYVDAVHFAVRSMLYFELINWIMRSRDGQVFGRNLPPDLAQAFSMLEEYKLLAQTAYDTFGQTSPYSALEFKRPESTRPDWNLLYGQHRELFKHNDYSRDEGYQAPVEGSAFNDIMSMVRQNAAEYRGEARPQTRNRSEFGDSFVNYDQQRNDFENMTPQNREEFRLSRFFHPIGKERHYLIPETDWKQIQHVFRKHAEQGPEETVQPGSFRIVIIDFAGETGWFSRIVRSEKYSMQEALSNPANLLPLLDDLEDPENYKVNPVPLKDVQNKTNMTVPVANCKKLEGFPLITVEEKIVSNDDIDMDATILAANNTIVKNFTHENATAFDVTTWNVYDCFSVEDKTRLFNDLPFLFKDSGAGDGPTVYQASRSLRTYIAQQIVDPGVFKFVDSVLTNMINNWLVNVCCYTTTKGKGTYLSIDSFIADMEDLSSYLKENDFDAHQALHVSDENTPLVAALKIFSYTNAFIAAPKEGEEVSQLKAAKRELELVVQRKLYVAVVNGRGGPNHTTGEAVTMRRSMYPEYFDLVESGFEPTMGEEASFDITDKILYFPDTNNMWLFNYTAFDPNVATLRHIAKGQKRVLLGQD